MNNCTKTWKAMTIVQLIIIYKRNIFIIWKNKSKFEKRIWLIYHKIYWKWRLFHSYFFSSPEELAKYKILLNIINYGISYKHYFYYLMFSSIVYEYIIASLVIYSNKIKSKLFKGIHVLNKGTYILIEYIFIWLMKHILWKKYLFILIIGWLKYM